MHYCFREVLSRPFEESVQRELTVAVVLAPEATFTDALYDHFPRAPGVPRLHGVLLQ